MGKQEYKWSDNVRFGHLPKVERKVITKMSHKDSFSAFEHTAVCTEEIGEMMVCFESHAWNTAECEPEIAAMDKCSALHSHDPDPHVLARQWHGAVRHKVVQFFSKKALGTRLR